MQIIKDVFLVSGFPYARHPNVYAVKGRDGLILVDTGLDEGDLEIINENIEYWGLSDYPISHVLITHEHFDHCGNAHIFKKKGARIVAGLEDAEAIETGDDRTIGYAFHKEFIPCKVDIKVVDGDIIDAAGLMFGVIHVPGHTPGSVFYKLELDGKTIFFTGDAIRVGTNCESAFTGWSGGIDYDMNRYFESIRKVAKLKPNIILAGHWQPCLKDGWKILQKVYTKVLLDWRQPATYV